MTTVLMERFGVCIYVHAYLHVKYLLNHCLININYMYMYICANFYMYVWTPLP